MSGDDRFNPSRGIAIIQTPVRASATIEIEMFQSLTRDSNHSNRPIAGYNLIAEMFQSLTRDSNHSNFLRRREHLKWPVFQSLTRDSNHSNPDRSHQATAGRWFQSLTRDSNHSNRVSIPRRRLRPSFNPSRGIAIIQTMRRRISNALFNGFQSLTRDSNHSNNTKPQDA